MPHSQTMLTEIIEATLWLITAGLFWRYWHILQAGKKNSSLLKLLCHNPIPVDGTRLQWRGWPLEGLDLETDEKSMDVTHKILEESKGSTIT